MLSLLYLVSIIASTGSPVPTRLDMTDISHQERASIVSIATNLLMNGYVIFRHLDLSGNGALDGADATQVWAKMVLWVIPIAIGLTIALNVLFAFAVKERISGMPVDERDRVFRLRGLTATTIVIGVGFIASLGGLAAGWNPLQGIMAFYASATLSDLIGNVVRVVSYRKGA